MNKEELLAAINNCKNKSDIYPIFGYSTNPNSRSLAKIKQRILEITGEELEVTFNKRFFITKQCPVCKKEFTRRISGRESNQVTCSNGCANTHFRSGINNPNFSEDSLTSHRVICFSHHKKECVVCKESIIVEVHHLDENHNNNNPENLVPLCPTHHKYWHSKNKYLIENIVLDYIKNFRV